MVDPIFTCLWHHVRAFPICLKFSGSFFSRVFEDFSKDKLSDFEGVGPYLPIEVCSCPLLISDHPDRYAFSYLIRPIQVLCKFHIFISMTLYGGPGHGHTYLRGNDCINPICKSELGTSFWSPGCCPIGPQDVGQFCHPSSIGLLQPLLQCG